ncbi:MAG: MATE family efflux transporter [Pseudomonadota bacterium]
MTSRNAQLTKGPVGRHLVRMALPMMLGIFAMMAFNLTDTWFVAQVGTAELAAISFTFPVVMVLSSVAIGLGAGTSSVLARAIGRGDWARVQRLATDSMILASLAGIILAGIGLVTIEPLFRLLGANEMTLPLIRDYMVWWYIGTPFLIAPMVGMAAIRATGDTRLPSLLMISSAVLNLILDPLLIFGLGPFPRLGLEGAALASLVVRVAFFAAAVTLLHRRMHMLTWHIGSGAELAASWRQILHVGLPAAGTNAIIPLATGVVTAMLAQYGQTTVAGFGVASRVESVVLIVFYALSAVIGPFAGQNLGVGRRDRILSALKLCTVFSLGFGAALALLLALAGRPIALLFDSQAEVVTVAATYLLIVPLSYGTAAMVMIMNAAFNGLGRPLPAVAISAARMLLLYVPLAWIGSEFYGATGIFIALALANVIAGVVAYVWVVRTVRAIPLDDETPAAMTHAGAAPEARGI